jgi:NAD(P)-dependent dehydrogenase (short-subunit alcohol dehydrogenase family)
MADRLNGAVALVTGASRGIGRAAAIALNERGANIVLASRDEGALAELADDLLCSGGVADVIPGDVTVAGDVDRMVNRVIERYGRIDLLVHTAGAGLLKPVFAITEDEFDRVVDLNLKGAFLTMRRTAAAMAEHGGGTIVAIPGVLGRAPMAMASAYCASKFGLVGLVKAMAVELKRSHVRFSLLFLGGVDTSFWDSEAITMTVQRERMLTAETAARACLFAAEQAAPGIVSEIVIQPENHQLL